MNATQILSEMEQEMVSTVHLLNIVPEDKLNYKPHDKAMSLGALALHVATIPGHNLIYAKAGQVEASVIVNHPMPASKNDILKGLEDSKRTINEHFTTNTSWFTNHWKLTDKGNTLAEMPAEVFVRTFVLNHWYHHRGQLSTYLRLLGLALPSIYGPSADVNPFVL